MANIIHIGINVSLLFWIVNARDVQKSTPIPVKTLAHLPGIQKRIDELFFDICRDLEFILGDEDFLVDACAENLKNPDESLHRVGLNVLCRSASNLQVEVEPADSLQLVLLIPEEEGLMEDDFINYRIIKPKIRFSTLSVFTPAKRYTIVTTTLDKHGRPSLWQGEAQVPPWSNPVPEHREYDIKVQFFNHSNDEKSLTGVVTWNETSDSDKCFEFRNNCGGGQMVIEEIWPDTGPRFVIEDLPLGVTCEIQVVGMYGTTIMNYQTPAQYEAHNVIESEDQKNASDSLDKFEGINLTSVRDGDTWRVGVRWQKPQVTPDWYEITLKANQTKIMKLNGNATNVVFAGVTGEVSYDVSLDAVKGNYTAHATRRGFFPASDTRAFRAWSVAGGAWGAVTLLALALVLCWRRARGSLYTDPHAKGLEAKALEEGCLEPLECDDQWEIKFERLNLHEVIGEGAFGVVKRGILAPTGKEVAVKMLKEFPSLDEIRAFRLEMELMKSVGAHPHVVSLVGCCSSRRPLIVAEYCARGDLLSFLRSSWDVMVSRRNAKYYNKNLEAADSRNDLFKIQRKNSGSVVNRMYDLLSICDTDLTSLDLLSFCRQIAMGMEFLASNKLVHRDLAARNVLVTEDKTLKIADFGLSRDVYEENEYKQKGNGKMPVKWMAPESLTRRIYTSQSDVWSFGVVVWEVVTLGGAPYPDVPAERLPRFLCGGYRMPRPLNCAKPLYEVMLSCWRTHPRERPTFTELHQTLDELLNGACAEEYLCLELDEQPPPPPRARRYFDMIIRGKWSRESYERPLKIHQGNYNRYTTPPFTINKV